MTAELDVSQAPLGQIAATRLVANVAKHGDMAERHYLELKSTLDLSTKKDKEKIAKFILGASNRMPEVASAAFEGYGVMIIGVSQNAIVGIPPVEMMEISKVIQQYLGAAGPRWDVVWVPIKGSKNQVLVVRVDPPKPGQGPFPCRANGESLTDGRIYIRAEGETREAKSDEVDLLIQRGVSLAAVQVDFAVDVVGEVAPVILDEVTTIDAYVTAVRERLVVALPQSQPPVTPATSKSAGGTFAELSAYVNSVEKLSSIVSAMTEPEKRTRDQYLSSIDRWEAELRSAWTDAVAKIAGSQLRPVIVKIVNRTTTFFHDVEMKLHLEGDVSAFDFCEPEWADGFDDLDLPNPPRKWGPTQRSFNIGSIPDMAYLHSPSSRTYVPPSISFKNGGSVTFELNVGDLRPRGLYESEDEEVVIVVADHSLKTLRGTWELTARDHNDIYTGEISVPVQEPHVLTNVARQILGLENAKGQD